MRELFELSVLCYSMVSDFAGFLYLVEDILFQTKEILYVCIFHRYEKEWDFKLIVLFGFLIIEDKTVQCRQELVFVIKPASS